MNHHDYAPDRPEQRLRSFLIACLSAAGLLSLAAVAWAHHSFSPYDLENPEEVEGTVTEFRFINPHSWIVLSVEDFKGQTVDYKIETNGSFYLARREGWKRTSLKPGDEVVARVHPLRDGSPGGDLIKLTLSDGSELVARRQALLDSLRSTPSSRPKDEEE